MKGLVLSACVLMFVSNSLSLKPHIGENLQQDIIICKNETDGWQNSNRKFGCFLVCVLKRRNLIEGTNIKENELYTLLKEEVFENKDNLILRNIFHACIEGAKNMEEECEKCEGIWGCVMMNLVVLSEEAVREHETEAERTTEAETIN
ncbi:pheromone-binding protein Gp-9 [Monomorium pharaonis]|uniref:pheromone-binding protein Gp-9 n=1 Tax=Monomorium pharaonis TaxID=307658 RepID=UPI00063F9C1C|nr:pheromone-binding protein Gp-9 [Monomorium pharaonis]